MWSVTERFRGGANEMHAGEGTMINLVQELRLNVDLPN